VNKKGVGGILGCRLLPPMFDSDADSYRLIAIVAAKDVPRKASRLEEDVTALFDQLRSPLLRYTLSLGLPVHEGEEVIQEAFLALFQHLQQEKSRRNLRGWLFRVTHNLALKRRHSLHQNVSFTAGMDGVSRRADPDPNPEEAVASRQRRLRLLAVVQALPEQDRWCLHLRAEGLRYREIAQTVGMSLGAVSISLVRSLARLARADGGLI
jgi:RNA polymerase sigma-70 factor (ECF subfamily)